jgi:hypothetical protein
MHGFLLVVVCVVGCDAPAEPAVAAPVPASAEAPPVEVGDLLGVVGEADAPMGLGMRGEGVQNGGPKYPGIGEIDRPLGYGTPAPGTVPARDDAPEKLGSNLWIDQVTVTGPLDAITITYLLRGARERLAYCYARGNYDAREDTGRLSFTVSAEGAATDVIVDAAALDATVRDCMAAQVATRAYPKGEGRVTAPLRLAVRR